MQVEINTSYERRNGPCWDALYRTPYLCVPKLVLISMPVWWQKIFVWLLRMCPDTPEYRCQRVDERGRYMKDDPWANYRHGRIEDVMEKTDV